MERMSDRHEGDLGGALPAFGERKPVTVRVVVAADVAGFRSVQHTAWMVLNLLARTDGIVQSIVLDCAKEPVRDRVIPFGSSRELGSRVAEAANLIAGVRVVVDDGRHADRTIHIGSAPSSVADITALGAGWWGGIAIGIAPNWEGVRLDHDAPFGPYMAATFAVGEIYLQARGVKRAGSRAYGWDCWAGVASPAPASAQTPRVDVSGVALAGVGAVGAAWMHAIWAYPSAAGAVTVVDADPEGVDHTNLNRGVLFTTADLGQSKALVAARAASGLVDWNPVHGRYEESGARPDVLVSAVDTNSSRDALQFTYRPRMLSGSTHDLRAEVLRVGTPGVGACLRCYNPPEPRLPDEEVRRRAFGHPDAVQAAAEALRITKETVSDWLVKPECGQISVDLTQRLRSELGDPELPQFSVGFVSVAAGTMLAAETIKVIAGFEDANAASTSIRLQYFDPASSAGRRIELRDSACPKCKPEDAATKVWSNRYNSFTSGSHEQLP